MQKKMTSLAFASILCGMLCSSITYAQQKLWGIHENQIFHINTDASGYEELGLESSGLLSTGLRVGGDHEFYFATTSGMYKFILGNKPEKIAELPYVLRDFFVEPDGTIYGLTDFILFKIENGITSVLHDFEQEIDTYLPILTDGNDGKLYICSGLTGLISINKDGSNYTTLDANLHVEPNRLLVVNEDLFGIGGIGGESKGFFKIKKDGTGFHKMADLNPDGYDYRYAKGSLLLASNGYIYGVSSRDKLFRVSPSGEDFSILDQGTPDTSCFTCTAELIELPDGKLYGINNFGDISLISISLDGSEKQLYNLGILADNSDIIGPLALGSDGKIYAQSKSVYDDGVGLNGIISITPSELKPVYSSDIGSKPSFLTKAENGEVFATMETGGLYGTVWKITPAGATKVADFPIQYQQKNIVYGGDGFVYGVGWAYPEDVGWQLFRLSSSGGNFQRFPFYSPAFENGKLLHHSNGGIYGVSEGGGNPRKGFVFKVKPDLSGVENIHNGSDAHGKVPLGKLIEGTDGYLFGTTRTGGSTLYGVIFKVKPDGTDFVKLHEFDNKNGRFPNGGLVQDEEGTLYGVAPEGGALKKGVLYKIQEDGSGFHVLRHFDATMPNPFGELILDSEGYLYGTAGASPDIKVFRIKKDGTDLSTFLEGNVRLYFASDPVPAETHVMVPADQATQVPIDSVRIQVSETPNAVSYTFELSESPDFDVLTKENVSYYENEFDIFGLRALTTYYARVKTNVWPYYGPTTSFTTGAAPYVYSPKLWGIQNNAVVYMNLDGSGYEQSLNVTDIDQNENPLDFGHSFSFIASTGNAIFGIVNTSSDDQNVLYRMDGTSIGIVGGFERTLTNFIDAGNGSVIGSSLCGNSCIGAYIFKLAENGEYLQTNLKIYGFNPQGTLIRTNDHKIIGMSSGGGAHNRGFIYSIRPDISGIDILYSFSGADGKAPTSRLTEGHDGRLYGVTSTGGTYNYGVIFSVQADGHNFNKLHDFTSNKRFGANPRGNLVQDGDDYLYGMCPASGLNKKGMIFRIKPDGSDFTIVYNFNGTQAANPGGNLLLEDDLLFGSAEGKFFSVKINGNEFKILHEGSDAASKLYFITKEPMLQDTQMINPSSGSHGGYSFFSAAVTLKSYSTQYTLEISRNSDFSEIAFTGSTLHLPYYVPFAEIPVSGLEYSTTYYARARSSVFPYFGPVSSFTTLAQTKRLFGLARSGGPTSCDNGSLAGGAVFSIELDGNNLIKHRDFPCANGILQGGLVQGDEGSLFGAGNEITGPESEIFKLDVSGNLSYVSNFSFHMNDFMWASNGSLYLAKPFDDFDEYYPDTSKLYRVDPNPATVVEPELLFSFDNTQGADVYDAPIEREDGYLYGLAAAGGLHESGTMYKIHPNGTGFQVLYNFNQSTGSWPNGKLIEDEDGNLYGTTRQGGTFNQGTVFRIEPDGTNHEVLHNFQGEEGSPLKTVLFVGDTLYGTTAGSTVGGTIYELHKNGTGYSVIHQFIENEAWISTLITDGEGYLYGTYAEYTFFPLGAIFKIKTNGSDYAILHNFTNYTGGWVIGDLLLVEPDQFMQTNKVTQHASARQSVNEFVSAKSEPLATISPNPFHSGFNIHVINKEAPSSAIISDATGRVLFEGSLSGAKPNELGEGLPLGFYIVRIVQGNKTSLHRIIKK